MLEKTLESPLDCKEIQLVHPKGDQSWVFIGRTDVEAETPILRPPDVKSWLIWKDPDAGKDWRWEEKGMTDDGTFDPNALNKFSCLPLETFLDTVLYSLSIESTVSKHPVYVFMWIHFSGPLSIFSMEIPPT